MHTAPFPKHETLVLLFWHNSPCVQWTLYIFIFAKIRNGQKYTNQHTKKKTHKNGYTKLLAKIYECKSVLVSVCTTTDCVCAIQMQSTFCLFIVLANEIFHEECLPFGVSCLANCFICCSSSTVSLHAWISKTRNIRSVHNLFPFTFWKWASNRFFLPAILLFCVCVQPIANKCVKYFIWFLRLLTLFLLIQCHILYGKLFRLWPSLRLKFGHSFNSIEILTVYFCVVCCHFIIQITLLCASLVRCCCCCCISFVKQFIWFLHLISVLAHRLQFKWNVHI